MIILAKKKPVLDTLIKLEENGCLTTELYMKPMTSPIILPFSSAHPIQTKRSVLHAQLLRAKRLGNSIPAQNRGMNQIESLLSYNGYPNKMIRKAKFFAITSDSRESSRGQKRSNNSSDTTYISLPFIDDSLSNKIQSVVKKSKLPVRIAWQSGSTLSEKLTSSALMKPPCPAGNKKCHSCMSGLDGKSQTKNAVYVITCNICTPKESYIGESKRSVRLRFNEHLRMPKTRRKTHLLESTL